MENDARQIVDLYVPRKCASSNRIITAKDHASVQLNIADVDANGVATGNYAAVYPLCGFIRGTGDADDAVNRLAVRDGLLAENYSQ